MINQDLNHDLNRIKARIKSVNNWLTLIYQNKPISVQLLIIMLTKFVKLSSLVTEVKDLT